MESNQAPGPLWTHWLLWGIPPDARGLPEAVPNTAEVPSIGPQTRQGTNSDKTVGWSGPCPPPFTLGLPEEFRRPNVRPDQPDSGKSAKTYTFKLYALDVDVTLGPETTRDDLLRAIDGHVLAGGELVGEFVGKVVSLNPLGRKPPRHPDSHRETGS